MCSRNWEWTKKQSWRVLYSFHRVKPVMDYHNSGGCPSICSENFRGRYCSLLRWVSLTERRYAYGRWYFDRFNLAGDILYCPRDADCVKSSYRKRSPFPQRLTIVFVKNCQDNRHRWSFYSFMIAILKKYSIFPNLMIIEAVRMNYHNWFLLIALTPIMKHWILSLHLAFRKKVMPWQILSKFWEWEPGSDLAAAMMNQRRLSSVSVQGILCAGKACRNWLIPIV